MQSSRTNFPVEVEQEVNRMINMYQAASHTYDHLSAACETDVLNMQGFSRFFRLCSLRTRRCSEHWMRWQTMRGGKLSVPEVKTLTNVSNLTDQGIENMVQIAIDMEKKVEQMTRELYQVARSKEDVATSEVIEKHCLQNQYYVIKMMVNHFNGLRQSQNGYLYDRITMMRLVKKMNKRLNCCASSMPECDGRIERTTDGKRNKNCQLSAENCPGIQAFLSPICN